MLRWEYTFHTRRQDDNGTTEQLQTDLYSVRSLIDRGKAFCLNENGVRRGTFRPVAAEHREGKRVFGVCKGDTMLQEEIEPMFYGEG